MAIRRPFLLGFATLILVTGGLAWVALPRLFPEAGISSFSLQWGQAKLGGVSWGQHVAVNTLGLDWHFDLMAPFLVLDKVDLVELQATLPLPQPPAPNHDQPVPATPNGWLPLSIGLKEAHCRHCQIIWPSSMGRLTTLLDAHLTMPARNDLRLNAQASLALENQPATPVRLITQLQSQEPHQLTFAGQLTAPLPITWNGTHNTRTHHGHGRLTVPPIRFTPGGTQPATLLPFLPPLPLERLSGTIALSGPIAWNRGEITGTLKLELDQLSASIGELPIQGVAATVDITRLLPTWAIAPHQKIRIDRIGTSPPVTALSTQFTVHSGQRIDLEALTATLAQGTIALAPMTIDRDRDQWAATFTMTDLNLGELAQLADMPGLAITGRLSGAITLIQNNGKHTIPESTLVTSQPCHIRYQNAATRQTILATGTPDYLLDALEDFTCQQLNVTIKQEPGGEAELRVTIAGSNPAVLDNQPMVLNLNISGRLEEMIQRAIKTGQWASALSKGEWP